MAAVLANWGMSAVERAAVDMFVTVSRATSEGNRLAGTHLPQQVVPNFLPNSSTKPQDSLDPYVAQLPNQEFMLFVGDLRPMKGLDVLLTAYAALQDAPPLVLIGKAWPDTPTELPPNTLVLHNWPNYAVMEAWRRSSIALVPSIWPEPFGIVVIEAMAGATPVIASRIGGIPGDPVALRMAMECLLKDANLRQRMGRAAKQRASDFEAGAVVPQIEAIYQQVMAS